MPRSVIVEIANKKGLHARAAAKFVKVVGAFNAQAQVMKSAQGAEGDSPSVCGSSILGLMMLGADPGSKLHITVDGPQAEEMTAALKELVENRFGEEE